MNDREKARDLGNQSAALARSIADVLNDTLDALEAAEAENARLRQALADVSDWDVYVGCGDDMRKRARAALGKDA